MTLDPELRQSKMDREATALQQTGQTYLVGTVAEVVALCGMLALDPRHVIVHGRLTVEDRPDARRIDRGCATADCARPATHEAWLYDGVSPTPIRSVYCPSCAATLQRGGEEVRLILGDPPSTTETAA